MMRWVVVVIVLGMIVAPGAYAQVNEEFFNRCGCSQEIIRLEGSGEQQNFCEDDALADTITFNSSQPKIDVSLNPVELLIKWIFGKLDVADDVGDLARGLLSTTPPPELNLQVAAPSPQLGDKVVVKTTNQGYVSPGEDDFRITTWWKNDVSMQGIVAGADPGDLPEMVGYVFPVGQQTIVFDEESRPNNPVYNDKPGCRVVTRFPDVDIDGDGIDDAWELSYFPDLVDSLDDLEGLRAVDPDADPDNDGYLPLGPRRMRPGLRPEQGLRPFGEVLHLTPDSSGGVTGDGVLTNREEYVWGLSPVDADTDGDGVQDEADLFGVGQDELAYEVVDASAAIDVVRASTAGTTAENGRVYVTSEATRVVVNAKDPLTMSLQMTPEVPTRERLPRFSVLVDNAQSADALVDVRWLIDGQDAVDVVGEGALVEGGRVLDWSLADIDELDLTRSYEVVAEVFEPETGRRASAREVVNVSGSLLLTYQVLEITDACVSDVCGLCEAKEDPLSIAAGDVVRVAASFAEAGVGPIGPGQGIGTATGGVISTPYNYAWSVNGARRVEDSGYGEREICVDVSREIEKQDMVGLEVIDQLDGNVLAQDELVLETREFGVDLAVFPENPVPGESVIVVVSSTSGVSADAVVRYYWSVDGEEAGSGESATGVQFSAGDQFDVHKVAISAELVLDGDVIGYVSEEEVISVSDEVVDSGAGDAEDDAALGLLWRRVQAGSAGVVRLLFGDLF